MIGRKINNYEVISLLGEGGMGSVYVAEHPVLGRRVAVKVLKREFAEDKSLVARFMNEARAASAIRQPNIIEILDVGTLPDGVPYLMMQLLEGESLAGRLHRDKRLSVEDALAIAAQAATALGAAHAKQIVHRDLKPDNLFLVPDAGAPRGQRLVILDFGIAKLRGELSTGSVQTHTGSVMGTPPYMSPEQCRGLTDEIDHRTDIYALGIILHEMLSGKPPFQSAGFGDLLIMHITQPPVPLRSVDSNIPPHVEAVVLRALQKPREARFSSMEELRSALVGPPTEAARAAVTSPPVRPKTISTLTSSTGEVLAVDPEQGRPTVPMRGPRRMMAAAGVVLGVGGAAIAISMSSGLGPSKRVAAPSQAATPSAVAAAAPRPTPPPPAAVVLSPPASPVPPPTAPAGVVAANPARTSKHATVSRTTRSRIRVGDPNRAAPLPASAPSSIPSPATAPSAVAPAQKQTPKVSADKW